MSKKPSQSLPPKGREPDFAEMQDVWAHFPSGEGWGEAPNYSNTRWLPSTVKRK